MKSSWCTNATLAAIGSWGACVNPHFQPLSASCVHSFSCAFTPGLWQLFPVLPAAYLFGIIGCCWIIARRVGETPEGSGWCTGWLCPSCSGVRQSHTPRSCLHACQGPAFHLETAGWLSCHQQILIFHLLHSKAAFSLYFPCSFGVVSCDMKQEEPRNSVTALGARSQEPKNIK